MSPSRTTTNSPSRNIFTVHTSSLGATPVAFTPRPSSSSSRSPGRFRTSSSVLQPLSTSHSVSQAPSSLSIVTLGSSLRTFLKNIDPPLIHYDVAIHEFGVRDDASLRALRDMDKEGLEGTLEDMQKETGMTRFQVHTFKAALRNLA